MKKTPTAVPSTLTRVATSLFPSREEQEAFTQTIIQKQGERRVLFWLGDDLSSELDFSAPPLAAEEQRFSFLSTPVSLVPEDVSPGKAALHEAGAFYSLDLSSVLAAAVLQDLPTAPSRVLDLCAAPGGKAIMGWKLLAPTELYCNEVIGKRLAPLISNLKRCRVTPVSVCSLDPRLFAERAPAAFDVCIVDAPCSGQSLPAKDKKWSGAFHPATINMNANRQRRILAHAAELVAPGGFLAYMTCTFSRKENERTVEWLLKKFPEYGVHEVKSLAQFQSSLTELPMYRFWPHRGQGRGGFSALLRRSEEVSVAHLSESLELPVAWQQDRCM